MVICAVQFFGTMLAQKQMFEICLSRYDMTLQSSGMLGCHGHVFGNSNTLYMRKRQSYSCISFKRIESSAWMKVCIHSGQIQLCPVYTCMSSTNKELFFPLLSHSLNLNQLLKLRYVNFMIFSYPFSLTVVNADIACHYKMYPMHVFAYRVHTHHLGKFFYVLIMY